MIRRVLAPLTLLGALANCCFVLAQTPSAAPPAQTKPLEAAAAPAKNDYSSGENWLCRPGRQDACAVDLAATIVAADGKLKNEPWAANPKAPIDCFYVYPTVSAEPTANSDMTPKVRTSVQTGLALVFTLKPFAAGKT